MEWLSVIKEEDKELFGHMVSELKRQREGLEMIPSENFASEAVMQASGSFLTNKYSEGYPGKRYYGGNQFVDRIETLAIDRAKELFGVPYVNVQPYSGSPANLEVHLAVCNPGDITMGQKLTSGGHLTHGDDASVTGKIFKSVQYGVNDEGYIDIEGARKLAIEHKPKLIWIGCTAYTREFPFEEFEGIADEVGAYLAADISHIAGLVAAGVHKSPVKYAHIITTTTHKTLRGPRGAMIMVTEKGVDKDEELPDKIRKIVFPGMQGGPHDHTTAGIAIALREASTDKFKEYARQIVSNAKTLAEELMKNGLKLVTNGTENHMLLIDLTGIGIGMGVFAQEALDLAGITMNKNTIPNEQSSPFYPSGLRLGTPAITTRGMKEEEMKIIAKFIADTLAEIRKYKLPNDKKERTQYISKAKEELANNQNIVKIRNDVIELCNRFPLYPHMVL